MPDTKQTEETIVSEVQEILALQNQVAQAEAELMKIEQFKQFLTFQKETTEKISAFWEYVKEAMVENNIKKIEGDWGSLVISDRIAWNYDPSQLAPKFFKKVVDEKKLTDTFRLEGKVPKAATPKYTKVLTKRLK